MERFAAVVVSFVLAVAGAVLVAPPAAARAPWCGQVWGSLDEGRLVMSAAEVRGVRAGRHACFDRLVVDLEGDLAGYRVGYVDAVRADGSGHVVPVAGGARLQVVLTAPTPPTDAVFTGVGRDVVACSGYRTFRQAVFAGSFEGMTTLGLGVRARLPFRTLLLDGPGSGSRLVVDVAHRW